MKNKFKILPIAMILAWSLSLSTCFKNDDTHSGVSYALVSKAPAPIELVCEQSDEEKLQALASEVRGQVDNAHKRNFVCNDVTVRERAVVITLQLIVDKNFNEQWRREAEDFFRLVCFNMMRVWLAEIEEYWDLHNVSIVYELLKKDGTPLFSVEFNQEDFE